MTTIDDRAERVARGAEFWDRIQPGWEWEIDLRSLSLDDCSECVLGQLCGNFEQAALNLSGVSPGDPDPDSAFWCSDDRALRWADDRGFVDYFSEPSDYPALRRHWVAAILARRGAGAEAEV